MLLLSRGAIMTATHDFEDVDANDVQEILNSAKDGAEMVEILRRVKFPLESGKTVAERKEYYEGLVELVSGLAKTKYSKSDKEICVAILLSGRWMEEDEIFDYCKSVSDKYLGKSDSFTDEIWYLFQKMNYDILSKQMNGDEWDFAEVKGFVAKLKEGKERFEKLNLEYEW